MRFAFSRIFWGLLILLAAALILLNQFYSLKVIDIGIGRIIIAVIAVAIIIKCIAHLHFTFIPIPLVALYIIFQEPLNLPYIQTWTLILASILAVIGLSIIFPNRGWHNYRSKSCCKTGGINKQINTEDCEDSNNPSVSLNFGAVSRRLHSNSLETVKLNCHFGALEIFFDQVQVSPGGAEVSVDCSFGAIVLYIPKEWRIIDKINCSLGGIEIDKAFSAADENAPKLTITGSVSLGGMEIKQV